MLHSVDKRFGLSEVVSLAASGPKTHQTAECVDGRVNLGTQAPARTAKTLLPLFLVHRQHAGAHA